MSGFALPHGFRLGDHVLVTDPGPARGLGRLDGFAERGGATHLLVHVAGRTLLMNDEAARRLGPALSAADASAMVAAFSQPAEPDERGRDDQHVASLKTLAKGTLTEIQERLAVLYASPWKLTPGEQRMIVMFETLLAPLLAHSLGRDEKSITADLRAGKPAFAATKDRPPVRGKPVAESPPLAGYESLYPLELDGEIWIGERPDWFAQADNGLAHLDVLGGRWHSYRRFDAEDNDEAIELLLVHESELANVSSAKWKDASEISAIVGSGAVNIVDRTALGDEDTMDRVRYLGGLSAYGGRALCVTTDGWEGTLPVLVSPPSGPATMVKIDLLADA